MPNEMRDIRSEAEALLVGNHVRYPDSGRLLDLIEAAYEFGCDETRGEYAEKLESARKAGDDERATAIRIDERLQDTAAEAGRLRRALADMKTDRDAWRRTAITNNATVLADGLQGRCIGWLDTHAKVDFGDGDLQLVPTYLLQPA